MGIVGPNAITLSEAEDNLLDAILNIDTEHICRYCIHYDDSDVSCKAYPDGILTDIITGKVIHNKILEGQEGDYIFEADPAKE